MFILVMHIHHMITRNAHVVSTCILHSMPSNDRRNMVTWWTMHGGLKYLLIATRQIAVLRWGRRVSVQTINNTNAQCANMSRQIPPLPFWWKAKESFFMKNKIINIFYFYYFDKAGNKNTMILTYYTIACVVELWG